MKAGTSRLAKSTYFGGKISIIFTPRFTDPRNLIHTELADHATGRCIMTMLGFKTNKFDLNSAQMDSLLFLALDFREQSGRLLEIYSRTDRAGSDNYNMGLSIRRLQAVQAFLLDQGVDEVKVLSKKNCKALGEAFWERGTALDIKDGKRFQGGRTVVLFDWPSVAAHKEGPSSQHKNLLNFGRAFPE